MTARSVIAAIRSGAFDPEALERIEEAARHERFTRMYGPEVHTAGSYESYCDAVAKRRQQQSDEDRQHEARLEAEGFRQWREREDAIADLIALRRQQRNGGAQ